MGHLGALLGARRETRASLLITEMKRNKHPARITLKALKKSIRAVLGTQNAPIAKLDKYDAIHNFLCGFEYYSRSIIPWSP